MIVDVVTHILIDRPLDEVTAFSSNPDNVFKWYKNIYKVEWQTERPVQVGSRISFLARFMGKELAYTYEITEWDVNKKLVMKTDDGPFPMQTEYCWEDREGSTYMTLRNSGMPKGFSKWMTPLMSYMMKRANQLDLKTLKTVLERG